MSKNKGKSGTTQGAATPNQSSSNNGGVKSGNSGNNNYPDGWRNSPGYTHTYDDI